MPILENWTEAAFVERIDRARPRMKEYGKTRKSRGLFQIALAAAPVHLNVPCNIKADHLPLNRQSQT